jgi:hypothetical protein
MLQTCEICSHDMARIRSGSSQRSWVKSVGSWFDRSTLIPDAARMASGRTQPPGTASVPAESIVQRMPFGSLVVRATVAAAARGARALSPLQTKRMLNRLVVSGALRGDSGIGCS